MNDIKKYITATELCTTLGVTKMTLHRWERDVEVGLPKPVRIKTTRFYPVADVQTWLEQARG